MGRPHKCPYCSATKSAWKGYRKRKNEKVRIRRCTSCKRKWTTRHTAKEEPGDTP